MLPFAEEEFIALASRWIALRPTSEAPERAAVVASELRERLSGLGFEIAEYAVPGRAPLIVAQRLAPKGCATIGIYGHYDIEPAGDGWQSDPFTLQVTAERFVARGIADNIGPLAQRLIAARQVSQWPGVLWILEGEEELGSPLLADFLKSNPSLPEVALWLDETGYFVDR